MMKALLQIRSLSERLEEQSKVRLASLAIALVIAISSLRYLAPPQLAFSLFYLIPIGFAAWFINQPVGYVISVSSALAWFAIDLTAEPGTYLYPAIPYWNLLIRLGLFFLISILISAQKVAYQREQQYARIDGLTGLYNRRFFIDILEYEANRARRYHYPLTLAYLDVDNFKAVNDHRGHMEGDRLLTLVATTLQHTLRKADTVARFGGDEFVILLPQTDYERTQVILPRVQQQLLKLNHDTPWGVGFSIGAVTFIIVSESVDSLIAQADHLMYSVKQNGKNQLAYELVAQPAPSHCTNGQAH